MTGRTDIEIEISNQCARLIANAVIFYNSAILSRLLMKYEGAEKRQGARSPDPDIAGGLAAHPAERALHLPERRQDDRPGCARGLRFLFASKPEAIGPVLGIVHRCDRRLACRSGRRAAGYGAMRRGDLIQRFGSALNLNIHFHMLWLDGVYEDTTERPQRKPRLHRTRAPTSAQLTELANTIAHRVCRHLTRKGWLEGEDESVFCPTARVATTAWMGCG